jgi:hypothetical protein
MELQRRSLGRLQQAWEGVKMQGKSLLRSAQLLEGIERAGVTLVTAGAVEPIVV